LFRVFGSFLTAGSIATFRYARRIALLPVGIIAQAVGVASYPLLSRLFQNNEIDELVKLVKKQLSYLFLISSSLMVIAIINSEYLIGIIYERGAFTNEDTIRVSTVFTIISLAIIPWSINQILTRSYYVQQRFWFPVVTGTFVTMLSSVVLLNTAKNAESYALVIIISLYVYCLTLLSSLKFNSKSVLNKKLTFEFFKISLMILVVYLLCEIIISLTGILNLIASLLLTVVVFFVSLSLLNFEYINITKRR
jgi:putative peptidoglycan lipid II flippase